MAAERLTIQSGSSKEAESIIANGSIEGIMANEQIIEEDEINLLDFGRVIAK